MSRDWPVKAKHSLVAVPKRQIFLDMLAPTVIPGPQAFDESAASVLLKDSVMPKTMLGNCATDVEPFKRWSIMRRLPAASQTDRTGIVYSVGFQVKRIGISEDVVQRFKDLIAQQVLPPGCKLPPERDLARALGVSRPTLRQAMKAMQILGVVTRRQGSGTYLTDSPSEILVKPLEFAFALKKITKGDLFETRKTLEVRLASLAAARRTDEDLKQMESALAAMRNSMGVPEQWCLHEMHFHECIAQSARNAVMITIMGMLSGLLAESRRETVRLLTTYEQSYRSHEMVFVAIRKKDSVRASEAMKAHFAIMEARARNVGLSVDPTQRAE